MVSVTAQCKVKTMIMALVIFGLMVTAGVMPASGHGGKSHGGLEFTSLQAVQKALKLYDKLIVAGKLPEEWETGLEAINVGTRQTNGKNEIMVQFKRAEGDGGSVYFFFDPKGEYSGSNFTGK